MVCIPSRQFGLIQNKLCGQKELERTAKGDVAWADDTEKEIQAVGRKVACKDSLH